MSKKFYSSRINVFWTFGEQLPKSHVRDLVTDWKLMKNNIEWDWPSDKLVLVSAANPPSYIKATDETNDFYFYYVGLGALVGVKDGVNAYERVYRLDEYMTYYWDKLQVVLEANPNVQFLRKFYDRFLYQQGTDGFISSATMDFYKQIQYLKAPMENVATVRKYIYGSTAESLYARQRTANGTPWDALPDNVIFRNWAAGSPHSRARSTLYTPNANNRYLYLVLKSSSKVAGDDSNPRRYAGQGKLIVPIFPGEEDRIISALFNMDITKVYPSTIVAATENLVGFYESEVPPALIAGASVNGQPVIDLECGYCGNDGDPNVVIDYFQMPQNYALRLQLSSSNDGLGISKKIVKIFNDAQSMWDVETEPLFLTDQFYKEIHSIDQNNRLETSISLITLTIDGVALATAGVNVHAYEFFDSTETSTYFYTDNSGHSCTNELNPVWNSNMSNRTTSLSLSGGLYDSASTNYYASNATTMYTSIANRKSEETQSWVDYGFTTAHTLVDTAATVVKAGAGLAGIDTVLNPGKTVAAGATIVQATANAALSIAQGATDNAMENERRNRSLASSIQNIQSSPATTASSPYVGICIPNISHTSGEVTGGYLYNTYAHEISDFDKLRIFIDYANAGYPCNEVNRISTFMNRQFCNILNISTAISSNIIWQLLVSQPVSLFNNQIYNAKFIAWLNSPHMFFTNNEIRNHFDPSITETYIPNLELALPPFPQQSGDIGKIVWYRKLGMFASLAADAGNYTTADIWSIIVDFRGNTLLGQELTYDDFTWVNVTRFADDSRLIATVKEGRKYSGTVEFYYTQPSYTIRNNPIWKPAVASMLAPATSMTIDTNQTFTFNLISDHEHSITPIRIGLGETVWDAVVTDLTEDGILYLDIPTITIDAKEVMLGRLIDLVVLEFKDSRGDLKTLIKTDSNVERPTFVFYRSSAPFTLYYGDFGEVGKNGFHIDESNNYYTYGAGNNTTAVGGGIMYNRQLIINRQLVPGACEIQAHRDVTPKYEYFAAMTSNTWMEPNCYNHVVVPGDMLCVFMVLKNNIMPTDSVGIGFNKDHAW